MSKPLYYENSLLTEEEFSDLSERFKIPYDLVAEVVAQIREDGEPRWASYTGTVRERIRHMSENITEEPEPTTVEPLPKSDKDDIVEHAAISLMQAMSTTESGSFIITDDGVCTINPSSPPSLEQSYEVVNKVIKLRELAPKMDDKTSWMLGSIVDELERYHGEDFEIGQIVEQGEKSYNTIWTAVRVYQAFKKKRYNLSFTHHKEAFFQKVEDTTKHLVLHKAELYGLSAKQVRALSVIAKKLGDAEVIKNIRSAKQAEDLIAAYKANKVLYVVYDDGKWTRVHGLASSIPTGKIVIDTKNWQVRANNGAPVEITKRKNA